MLGTTLTPARYREMASDAARADTRWLELDPAAFRQSYNREPFLVAHRLAQHDAFRLDELKALCRRMPQGTVNHRIGVVPINTDFDKSLTSFRKSLTLDDALDAMEERQAYVVVNNPEIDREYRPVIEGLLGELACCTDSLEPFMNWYSTYLFISAHHSVTPYHMDREMNFLLQIRGTKTVRLWNPSDDEVMTPAQKDELLSYAGEARPQYHDGLASKAMVYELKPGLGVHHPYIAPHLVHTGPELSISLAITFRTRQSDVWRDAHRLNHSLRAWGIHPTSVRKSMLIDRTKAKAVSAVRWARTLMRKKKQ
jgi:hypothetical protein